MSETDQSTLTDTASLTVDERLDRAHERAVDAVDAANTVHVKHLCREVESRLAAVATSGPPLDDLEAEAVHEARQLLGTVLDERTADGVDDIAREVRDLLDGLGRPSDTGVRGGSIR